MNLLVPAHLSAPYLPLLPPQMTEEELRGFNIALGCVITWGSRIAHEGVRLSGDPETGLMRDRGHFAVNLAEALHLTLGRGRSLPARRP